MALGSQVSGQEMDRFVQDLDHVFTNEDGEVIASGTFKKVSGGRAVIDEGNGEEIKILISGLCKEDQQWVKKMSKAQRDRESARKKFKKIMEDSLNSQTDSKVASGLNSVRKLGKSASFATGIVERYMQKSYDDKIRYRAFLAYIATKYASETGMRKVFEMVISDHADAMDQVARSPGDFMTSIATFEELGLPYLKSAAFSGVLVPEDSDPIPPSEASTDLNRDQNRVRAAAVAALSTLPGEDTLQVVIEVLEAADQPDDGEPDAATIKACLKALGDMEIAHDDVEQKLDDYEKDYSRQVESARKKIARANEKKDD